MNKKENLFKKYILLYVKGLGVGAADSVPGISGGTIAFITGIYEELIYSLRSLTPKNFKLFFTGKIKAFWKAINGNFLLVLVLGIATGLLLLAKFILSMLDSYPVATWSFFFGLVIISTISVLKTIRNFSMPVFIAFGTGAVLAFLITIMSVSQTPNDLWFIFVCGAVAICAMILPGISGAFILLLMGKYKYILDALLTDFKIDVILVFACGAIVGLLSFSHFLSWLLRRFHDITIAMLAGFMFGALNKIWPWKVQVDSVTSENYLPCAADDHLYVGIASAAVAVVIFMTIETIGKKKKLA